MRTSTEPRSRSGRRQLVEQIEQGNADPLEMLEKRWCGVLLAIRAKSAPLVEAPQRVGVATVELAPRFLLGVPPQHPDDAPVVEGFFDDEFGDGGHASQTGRGVRLFREAADAAVILAVEIQETPPTIPIFFTGALVCRLDGPAAGGESRLRLEQGIGVPGPQRRLREREASRRAHLLRGAHESPSAARERALPTLTRFTPIWDSAAAVSESPAFPPGR